MRKYLTRVFVFNIIFICIVSGKVVPIQHASADKITTVTVDGVATINHNDKARARDDALKDAYRRAIEKGIGVAIHCESVVDMMILLKDIIRTESKGYVKSWRINDEGRRGKGLYYVNVTAEVVNRKLQKEDVSAFKIIIDLMGNPRFIVLIDETNLGQTPQFSITESMLIKELVGYGYHNIDPEQTILNENPELLKRIKKSDNLETKNLDLRIQNDTDIIIVGKVYTEITASNEDFKTCKAYSFIRMIIVATGEIVDVESLSNTGIALTQQEAGQRAIKDCMKKLSGRLIGDIPLHIGKSRTVQVIVRNVRDYTEYINVKSKIANMRNITNVSTRGWEKQGKPAIFDVETISKSEDLAMWLHGDDLEVEKLNLSKIELRQKHSK